MNETKSPYMQQSRHDDGRMTREETIKWLESLKAEIGKAEHRTLWHYAEAIDMAIEALSAEETMVIQTGQTYGKSGYIKELAEVVRCKDCKWQKFIDWGMGDCLHPKGSRHIAYDNHYCSYGERREE